MTDELRLRTLVRLFIRHQPGGRENTFSPLFRLPQRGLMATPPLTTPDRWDPICWMNLVTTGDIGITCFVFPFFDIAIIYSITVRCKYFEKSIRDANDNARSLGDVECADRHSFHSVWAANCVFYPIETISCTKLVAGRRTAENILSLRMLCPWGPTA